MEHGNDTQEAAAGDKIENVLAHDSQRSQEVKSVAVQHPLQVHIIM